MSPSSPVEYAKQRDVEYFKTIELNVLQNFKGEYGDGILALAAYEGVLDCCEVIYQRCPEQLFCQNRHGNSILHHVAHHRGEMLSLLKFFLDIGAKAKGDIESGVREDNVQFKEWCKLQNQDGETALLRTIKMSNLEAARLWLNVDHDYKLQLLSIANNNEGNTPLHLAVGYEDLQMVKLLIRDKLDFEYVANRNGMTPLSLAIHRAQSRVTFVDDPSVRIRQLILESQPDQTKVRTGDKKWTLLHSAAYNGDLGLVEDIIRFHPYCMDTVDSEGQNFLHIAAKFKQIEVVENILGAKEISVQVLNGQDNNGDTPLHIAARTGNEPITLRFLYDPRVVTTTVNKDGEHVRDAIKFKYDKKKAGLYGRLNENDLMNQSNVGLVVAALIATVSFTAGITVPGGYISEGPNQGMAILSKSRSFGIFLMSNNLALLLSLYAVVNYLCGTYLHERKKIVGLLDKASQCIVGAMLAMLLAFMTGSYAILATSNKIAAIYICVFSSLYFIFVYRSIMIIFFNIRVRNLSFSLG